MNLKALNGNLFQIMSISYVIVIDMQTNKGTQLSFFILFYTKTDSVRECFVLFFGQALVSYASGPQSLTGELGCMSSGLVGPSACAHSPCVSGGLAHVHSSTCTSGGPICTCMSACQPAVCASRVVHACTHSIQSLAWLNSE